MDYTKSKTIFKIKKVLRYIKLYGPGRTYIKVKGQYHMNREYQQLPVLNDADHGGHVGILGCGNYAYGNIAYYLAKRYGKVIRGAMDININRAASLSEQYGAAYFTDDPEKIINDPKIDLIYIASNHATHAEYAVRALEQGKNVYIEKPHVVRFEQLYRLIKAAQTSKGKILSIGYNRPKSKIGTTVKKYLSGQKGPTILNWFIVGHELNPEHWYLIEEEGGRVLGNLCHWTDFTYMMIDEDARYPITIIPVGTDKCDSNMAVNYVFGDGSIAAITFSAEGYTFEGVREKLSVRRGDVLISMDDFEKLTVEIVEKKIKVTPWFRDHGHQKSICDSYLASIDENDSGQTADYVWEAAQLFLKTKEALETNQNLVIQGVSELKKP